MMSGATLGAALGLVLAGSAAILDNGGRSLADWSWWLEAVVFALICAGFGRWLERRPRR